MTIAAIINSVVAIWEINVLFVIIHLVCSELIIVICWAAGIILAIICIKVVVIDRKVRWFIITEINRGS